MVSFSTYGMENDVSGVTSWLRRLVDWLLLQEFEPSLRIHEFGGPDHQSELLAHAGTAGVQVSATRIPPTTRKAVLDILEYLNVSRPEVFLPQVLPAAHFAAFHTGRLGLPWALTLHSDDPWYWALLESCGPGASEGVCVAVSDAIASQARRLRPDADVRHIPYGVMTPETQASWNDSRFRIVFSGRMVEEQKRISLVIGTLISACRLSNRIEAMVIGDGYERERMEQKVRHEGLADRIVFRGRIAPDEVIAELLHAQAILLMSDYEGLPIALLEGMGCGLVPLARNIRSGVPEIIRHTETGLRLPDEPGPAGVRIAELATNREEWTRMSIQARGLIQKEYSIEQSNRRWGDLIRELANRKSVSYPVSLNARLPTYDARLAQYDQRLPVVFAKVVRKIRRILYGKS